MPETLFYQNIISILYIESRFKAFGLSVVYISRAISTSKFEPVAARRAFPCFDEPNMKAEFTVTLIHRPDYIALSNMPVQVNRKSICQYLRHSCYA